MDVQNKVKRKLLSKTGTSRNKQIVDFRLIFLPKFRKKIKKKIAAENKFTFPNFDLLCTLTYSLNLLSSCRASFKKILTHHPPSPIPSPRLPMPVWTGPACSHSERIQGSSDDTGRTRIVADTEIASVVSAFIWSQREASLGKGCAGSAVSDRSWRELWASAGSARSRMSVQVPTMFLFLMLAWQCLYFRLFKEYTFSGNGEDINIGLAFASQNANSLKI